jgi:hypothetical protein
VLAAAVKNTPIIIERGGSSVPIGVLYAGAGAVVLAALLTLLGVWFQTRRTLKHERALREREELRGLVDEAASHIDAVVFGYMQAFSDVREVAERDLPNGVDDLPGIDDLPEDHPLRTLCFEKFDELFRGVRQAAAFKTRLHLRLGPKSPVVTNYDATIVMLGILQKRFAEQGHWKLGENREPFSEAGRSNNAFVEASHQLIGTKLNG